MAEAPKVDVGMILLYEDRQHDRVEMWTVSAVRQTRSGTTATLISGTRTVSMKATARFPDGQIREPWRLWEVAASDRRAIYRRLGEIAAAASEGGESRG